ncbi:hypothetical protein N431DRAFT_140998 [Stipitochalara longipes BDJ]|nr:hypothetical protein N431DRAFT_140998 [Stipitochalara longipes BDJ]
MVGWIGRCIYWLCIWPLFFRLAVSLLHLALNRTIEIKTPRDPSPLYTLSRPCRPNSVLLSLAFRRWKLMSHNFPYPRQGFAVLAAPDWWPSRLAKQLMLNLQTSFCSLQGCYALRFKLKSLFAPLWSQAWESGGDELVKQYLMSDHFGP